MTDIHGWQTLIGKETVGPHDTWSDKECRCGAEYYVLPFNSYQMGNLLGALIRTEATGDWWEEIIAIVRHAMEEYELELGSNWGDKFDRRHLSNLRPEIGAIKQLEQLQRNLDRTREEIDDLTVSLGDMLENATSDAKKVLSSLEQARDSLQRIQEHSEAARRVSCGE